MVKQERTRAIEVFYWPQKNGKNSELNGNKQNPLNKDHILLPLLSKEQNPTHQELKSDLGIVKILLQDIGVSWNKENMRHSWLVKDLSIETEIQINSYESRKLKIMIVFGTEEKKEPYRMLINAVVYMNSKEIRRGLYRNWNMAWRRRKHRNRKTVF